MLSLIPLKWRAKFHFPSALAARAQEVDSTLGKLSDLIDSVRQVRQKAAEQGLPAEKMVAFDTLVEIASTQFLMYVSLRSRIELMRVSHRLMGTTGGYSLDTLDMSEVDAAFENAMKSVKESISIETITSKSA